MLDSLLKELYSQLPKKALTKEMVKSFYFLLRAYSYLKELVEKNPEIKSLALYGSHASGKYNEKSDVELLIISQGEEIDLSPLKNLEKETKKKVKACVYSSEEWRNLVKKNDSFALSVLRNHILIYGAELKK